VARTKADQPLAKYDPALFYTADAKGYTDYPVFADQVKA
jgi:hypothetical protein